MRFSVGLGLTNACNLSCAHCYRDTGPAQYLTLAAVRRVCESLPVRAANLGTGENGLHPEFHAIVGYLRDQDVPTSITSNGYTLSILDDEELRAFHDVEVSIDVKPNGDNIISARAEGAVPVAILWSAHFDPVVRTNRTSLTFGKTGNEPSLRT